MDCVRAIKTIIDIIKIPIDLVREENRLERKLKNGLQNLKYDLDVMKEDLKSYQELQLLELVCEIEDFVLGLWIPKASGPALSAFALDPREGYLDRIESFQKRLGRLEKRQEKSTESRSEWCGGCSADASRGDDTASSSAARVESLVGIEEPRSVLMDMINAASTRSRDQASGQEAGQPPKVISIVGCPGVGKTTLARAVYHHYRNSDDFNCVAWVEASECNNKAVLLSKIIEKVQADLARRASPTPVSSEGDGNVASPDLHVILADKRYLVVMDNMKQAEVCYDIQNDFPENGNSSMVIVTTSDHSVVNNVSSSGTYVHTMQRLPPKESEKLFWKSFDSSGSDPAPSLSNGSQCILSKCDGLPLALISVAKHLRITRGSQLDANDCVMVGKELGRYLVGGEAEPGFRELRRALGQCYDGLPQSDYRSCMLYLSIFPRNHPIKRKSLVRRLIAEGLVANSDPITLGELHSVMDHGKKCLDGLVNRCIVEPVQVCSCSKNIKSCPVNGIMLEFIIRKSQSTNLVTLIRKKEVVRNTDAHIRRLSVQSSTKDTFDNVASNGGLSAVRSLTIFSSKDSVPSSDEKLLILWEKGSGFFGLKKCKFLRLLDLDDCKGLDEEVLKDICDFVYLKYLRLRKTDVKKIPSEIRKLHCLQTLDIQERREIELPIEAIMLPKLVFLFGQFVLPQMSNDTKQFLSTRSELHTLAGFVVDKADGSEQIILEARNLRKIEVWYKDTCASSNPQTSTTQDFVSSLQKHFTSLDSLSSHSSQLSQDILATLEKGPCKIRSMKLWEKLDKLPGVATLSMLNNLRKLQLFDTGLTSYDLSMLQHMSCLEYLKLQDNQNDSWDGCFSVVKDGFASLRRLCFQASKLPKLEFKTESMKSLTSLHLLCTDISQMQVAEEISKSIAHITSLNEVILYSSDDREIVEAWETAAKNNANRPRVNQLQKQ